MTVTAEVGAYTLDASVTSAGTSGSAAASVTFVFEDNYPMYLPLVTDGEAGTSPSTNTALYLPLVAR
ncbi:MAG: hypothetical protein R2856_19890 [Caldilineaceae bacterium]